MDEIAQTLAALEHLSACPSTSASGPLQTLLEQHFAVARERIHAGSDPKQVIKELSASVARSKKEVEKGLKGWYAGLNGVGKAVEKSFPPTLAGISDAYATPPLFASPAAKEALDKAVMDSLGRRGLWDAVAAMEEDTSLKYDDEKRALCEELYGLSSAMEGGNLTPVIEWCDANATFLSSPPHPSHLPYHLHRAVFLALSPPAVALAYARTHLMAYLPTQPVLALITSVLYPDTPTQDDATEAGAERVDSTETENGHMQVDGEASGFTGAETNGNGEPATGSESHPYASARATMPLVEMFQSEFCRRHGLPKEDLLGVAVALGGQGGALGSIEKVRKLAEERLGSVREWDELPIEVPLPSGRRYHSVFVCPVSKEQATDVNPPLMLSCGHVIATESFQRLIKGGRRSAKCPYCPVETSQTAAQRLFF